METCENEKMPPEGALEILKRHGFEITVENARIILDLLNKLANIAVSQYLRK
jgi:hypothetical protein